MDKINFKFYNLNITQESKIAWEKNDIKNPRFSIKGITIKDLTIDELEELLIENIQNSLSDLRDAISIGEFKEAKIIMPALQICSTNNLDIIDFGINIINPEQLKDETNDDLINSEWNHPSEMWEDFADQDSHKNDIDDTEDLSEIEKIIKSNIKNE